MKKIVLISFILLTGCATQSGQNNAMMSSTAKAYLQQAATSEGVNKQRYQLLAVDDLLTTSDARDSQQLLEQFSRLPLNEEIASQKNIAQARLELLKNHPAKAIKALHRIRNPKSLSPKIAMMYYATAATAHLRNNDLAYSTISLISLNSLLNDNNLQQQNRLIIWRNLQTLSKSQLDSLLQRCDIALLRGWIQLAKIAKENANNPTMLYKKIKNWQQQYQDHPANNILPTNVLENLMHTKIPTQIALLLPLHGTFADMGKAVLIWKKN